MREIQPRLNFGRGKDAMDWTEEPRGGGGRLGGGAGEQIAKTQNIFIGKSGSAVYATHQKAMEM